jgi:hypothetical protein
LSGLYAEIIDRFQTALDTFITGREGIEDRLEGHRRMRRYLLFEDTHLLIAWKGFTCSMWTDPVVADIIRPSYRAMRNHLLEHLETGLKEGKLTGFSASNPAMAAAIILAMYDGSLKHMWLDPEEMPIDEFEDALRYLYGEPGARDTQ